MIGVAIPHLGNGAGGGTLDALVAVIALLVVGFVLLGFALWGSRAASKAERSVRVRIEPRALPNAA